MCHFVFSPARLMELGKLDNNISRGPQEGVDGQVRKLREAFPGKVAGDEEFLLRYPR